MLTSAASALISSWKTTETFEDSSGGGPMVGVGRDRNRRHDNDRRDNREPDHSSVGSGLTVAFWIILAIEILIGALAAYLSWWANTLVDWNIPLKLLFSFFAFLSSWGYIIAFLILKIDMALYVKRSRAASGPMMQQPMQQQQQQQVYGVRQRM